MANEQHKLEQMQLGFILMKPVYEPYNEQAMTLLETLYTQLAFVDQKPSSIAKQLLVLSSILAVAQQALEGIAIPSNNNYWSQFPRVGKEIAYSVRNSMMAKGYLEHIPDTGARHFFEDEEGNLKWVGLISSYSLDPSILNMPEFYEAVWIETAKPLVQVSKSESRGQRKARELQGKIKPKMTLTDVKSIFGEIYGQAKAEVEELNTFMQDHPLKLPPLGNGITRYAACSTRVFHDSRMDAGGRYYGAWTTMGSARRLSCEIDGEPVAQIDLNASQPTLFSSLMGIPLKINGMWDDLYKHIFDQVDLTGLDVQDDAQTIRGKVKQVAVEVIGTGNPEKAAASSIGKYKFVDGEFARYRNALMRVVPALLLLDDEHHNGAGYISYHESEMMKHTLHKLKDMGIPAYPVHDCCLVKERDVDVALNTYRDIIRAYIKAEGKGNIDITVPVSVERKGQEKQRHFGYYS